jgi:hypothetical protein
MIVLGEKLRWVPWATQSGLEVELETLFSLELCMRPTLLMTSERLLYADHVRYIWSRDICGSSVESVWRVDQVFPVVCTSIQIVVTLGYE